MFFDHSPLAQRPSDPNAPQPDLDASVQRRYDTGGLWSGEGAARRFGERHLSRGFLEAFGRGDQVVPFFWARQVPEFQERVTQTADYRGDLGGKGD